MPRKQTRSGSPDGEPEYLVVGYLRRPHGVQGEIIMDLHTDFPERLKPGSQLFIGEQHTPVRLAAQRPFQNGLLVKFKTIETPELVGRFRNQWVFIKKAGVQALPPGQLYQYQLIGLQVVEDSGYALGELVEILETGANDVYVVRKESGGELLLPAIPSVILEVNLESRIMRVHLLEGL